MQSIYVAFLDFWYKMLAVIDKYLDIMNNFMYSKFLIIILIFVGIYFTFRTKFVQVRLFGEALKCITEKDEDKSGLSSFQALMIATASRVGTGNIAGVTTAIVIGGAGSVFWMWIMAIVGSASAFIESTLAQIYKEEKNGELKGGPAYYIEKALGQRWLGILFSIILILTFSFGFNGLQSYTITSSYAVYFDNFTNGKMPHIIGGILAIISLIVFFGATKLISKISSIVVPIMAIIYIAVGIIVFILNIKFVPSMFNVIFREAFNFKAMSGGFAGSCLVIGIKRGLYSNEAGMGSAPNAAAAADVSHPVKQGLVQILSVVIDTLIICTTTAFMVLLAGPKGLRDEAGELLDGIPYVQRTLFEEFGQWGIVFITISITLFAATSIIGNYFYAESNMHFITNNKYVLFIFKILSVLFVYVGSQVDMKTAWNMADFLMGSMATINCIAILFLGSKAIKVLEDYEKQRRENKNPVFKSEDIGIKTDYWI